MRNTYASNAALEEGNAPPREESQGIRASAVYQSDGPRPAETPGIAAKSLQGLDDELLPIPEAAERYGVDVKRLRGAVFRGCTRDARLSDPIGSLTTDEVYAWSVERWAKRVSP